MYKTHSRSLVIVRHKYRNCPSTVLHCLEDNFLTWITTFSQHALKLCMGCTQLIIKHSACTRITVVIVCVREGGRVLSVITLVATYLVYMYKMRQYTVPCMLLKMYIVWISLKTFRLGDMALFACHDDRWLWLFLDTSNSWHDYKWHSTWTAG